MSNLARAGDAAGPMAGIDTPGMNGAGGEAAEAITIADNTSRSTHFCFQHKVFNVSGAYFSVTQDTKQPVLNFLLGDLKAAIPFPTLCNSFDIPEGSHDAKLLDIVAKGLNYVKVIRPGESIPPELLNGTASWQVETKHRLIAKGRVTLQLVSWITGNEAIVVDLSQLEQLVEDPITKQRLQAAFAEIARRLGIGDDRRQEVVDKVDELAHELAYIEALRDRYGQIRDLNDKLAQLQRLYRADRNLSQELFRMQGLMRKPVREFDGIFDLADAQTSEILAALKTFDAQVAFIRQVRDDLHIRLMDWDDILDSWKDEVIVGRSTRVEQLLKGLYRFLAQKYIETKVWERK